MFALQNKLRTRFLGISWMLEERGCWMELFYFLRDLRKDGTEQKDPRL